MKKKYEFTGETMEWKGYTLRRIRAIRDISNSIPAGDLGGWIEDETNLSHEDSAWVWDDAKVYNDAVVRERAKVHGNASISSSAEVFGSADVYDNARVFGDAKVYDNAVICGNASVFGGAKVYGTAAVYHEAGICDDAKVYGGAMVYGNALISDNAEIFGKATVCSNARLCDGKVDTPRAYLCLGPVGPRNVYITLNLASGTVRVGCFEGTIDEYEVAVKKQHGDSEYAANYADVIDYFRARIKRNQTSPATD